MLQRPSAPCRLLLLCPSAPLPRCTQRPFAPPWPSAPLPLCPFAILPLCPSAPLPPSALLPPFPCPSAPLHLCPFAPLRLCPSAPLPRCPSAPPPPAPPCTSALCASAPLPLSPRRGPPIRALSQSGYSLFGATRWGPGAGAPWQGVGACEIMSWTLGWYGIRTQDFGNKAGVCYFDNMKYDTSSISVSTAARRFTCIYIYIYICIHTCMSINTYMCIKTDTGKPPRGSRNRY